MYGRGQPPRCFLALLSDKCTEKISFHAFVIFKTQRPSGRMAHQYTQALICPTRLQRGQSSQNILEMLANF